MKIDPAKTELVGDIRMLDFVALSYAESCLTLLKRLNEYNDEDSISANESRAYRYLPAMFCFRHYLESRLKYLYTEITRTQPNSQYGLTDLLNVVKQNGFSLSIFDEPIKFIDQIEKNRVEHFRYLITKKFTDADELEVPDLVFDKVKDHITNIERQCKRYVKRLDSERLRAS